MSRRRRGVTKQESEWLAELPDAYLQCRDTTLNHQWDNFSAERDGNKFIRVVRCLRCNTEKKVEVRLDGLRGKTKVAYPDGYLRPKGMGRITSTDNANVRLESTLRLLGEN